MEYTVTAVSPQGERTTFQRTAETPATLAALLRGEGYAVIAVNESAKDAPAPADLPRWHPAWLRRATRFDAEMGFRQLAAMLRSGMTLLSALCTASAQAASPRASLAWRRVADRVYAGGSFAEALAERERLFGEVAVRLAEVGERSGELERSLERAAEQMEARRNLRTTVANALMYPALAMTMAVGVSAYLATAVIPKIADFLKGGNAELPAITQMLVDVSDWTVANGLAVLAWCAAAAAAWAAARATAAGRELEDAMLLRLPLAGRILRLSGTALFARSMQMMTDAGVTLLDALGSAARLVPNRRLRRRVEETRDEVMRGTSLAGSLGRAGEFMPALARMAAVGEASGALPEAFGECARFHETLLALAVRRFGMMIEPAMIVIAAGVTGFVYVAFFMALFSIAGAT